MAITPNQAEKPMNGISEETPIFTSFWKMSKKHMRPLEYLAWSWY
jgi:hypothetical protein